MGAGGDPKIVLGRKAQAKEELTWRPAGTLWGAVRTTGSGMLVHQLLGERGGLACDL